ncbi:hypothetical protein AAMO2058_001639200 [Amorphochlora amoebiformis]
MGDGAPKPLCVAVIGPVSGGKSTLCGRIIAEFNGIEAKQLVAYRQAAREAGLPDSVIFSWVVNRTLQERLSSHTVKLTPFCLKLTKSALKYARVDSEPEKGGKGGGGASCMEFTIIDCPGRPGMERRVSEASSLADAAIITVSAKPDEFESSLMQFRQHASAALATGMKTFIVAVTKMDDPTVAFSPTRYAEVEKAARDFLRTRLKPDAKVYTLPVACLTKKKKNANISRPPPTGSPMDLCIQKSKRKRTQCLVALLASLKRLPKRSHYNVSKRPLRMFVYHSFQAPGAIIALGRVETGEIYIGQNVTILPIHAKARVVSIEHHYERREKEGAGSIIGVGVNGMGVKLKSIIHRTSGRSRDGKEAGGEILEISPKSLGPTERGLVIFTILKPLFVQPTKDCFALGRIVLRNRKIIIAAGSIKSTLNTSPTANAESEKLERRNEGKKKEKNLSSSTLDSKA